VFPVDIRSTNERSPVTSVRLRLLAITDIAFWQKISGAERPGPARGAAERGTAQKGTTVESDVSCLPSVAMRRRRP